MGSPGGVSVTAVPVTGKSHLDCARYFIPERNQVKRARMFANSSTLLITNGDIEVTISITGRVVKWKQMLLSIYGVLLLFS